MEEVTTVNDIDRTEQDLLVRQTALVDALSRWYQDMDREEHTTDFEENKRNIVALKGRRMALLQEEQSVRRGLRESRRRHNTTTSKIWPWKRHSNAAGR